MDTTGRASPKVLLALASCASALLLMEIAFRVMPAAPTPAALRDRSLMFFQDDEERRHPWSAVSGATNALRIAIVGDSFARGEGIQLDDRYANCLERLLNKNSGMPPAEVRVHAHAGTSTFEQIELLKEALAHHPQIVILGICLNDTEDWANPKELEHWRSKLLPVIPPPWLAGVLRRSRALGWIYTKVQLVGARRMELRYYRRLYDPCYKGFHRFREALEIMRTECDRDHVILIAMVFPLLSENLDEGQYPFEYAHAAIHKRCEELRIPCLDLLPAFRGASPDRLQVIPVIDPHPNEIAHRMAAENLLEFLLTRGFIAAGYRPHEHAANHKREIWEQTIHRMQNPAGLCPSSGLAMPQAPCSAGVGRRSL